MSGLNLGSLWTSQLSIQMMADYITGQLGGPKVCSERGKGRVSERRDRETNGEREGRMAGALIDSWRFRFED